MVKGIEMSGLAVNFKEVIYGVKYESPAVILLVCVMSGMFLCTFTNSYGLFMVMAPHLMDLVGG